MNEMVKLFTTGVIKVNDQCIIEYANEKAASILTRNAELVGKNIKKIVHRYEFINNTGQPSNLITEINGKKFLVTSLFVNESGRPINLVLFQELNKVLMEINRLINNAKTYDELRIFELVHNVMSITDEQGIVLYVSPYWEKRNGMAAREIVGKHISYLEKIGMFNALVTVKALEEKRKVSILQHDKQGEKILCTGVPVLNENNEIQWVVSFDSWDITNYIELKEHYEKLCSLMEHYSEENMIKEISNNVVISKSVQMQNTLRVAMKVAQADTSILITGESGVGKNLIATIIHENSPYNKGPFIDINCGAIPENLMESELFGYERGAFTGARNEGKVGLVELANNGTLFLDEVGELPLSLQVKLLKVIQEKKINRVGGTQAIPVKFRLIAATNQNLLELVKKGQFREDLFYRLNVVPIHIPPLRERLEDLLLLIMHLTGEMNRRHHKNKTFSEQAVSALMAYSWPGNVRELQNIIERVILTSDEDLIKESSLPDNIANLKSFEYRDGMGLKKALELYEKQLINKVYNQNRTTVEIGKILGISQSSAVRKLKKYVDDYSETDNSIQK